MRCPCIAELPPPPADLAGWPWTEGSHVLPQRMTDGTEWPRISVVSPSFNQARYLEATLRSILLQGYPNLEYFVLDGGSTDGSIDIIKRYAPWLTYWVSERDGGQSAAINRGLNMSSGALATWINSDDMLCQNALGNLADGWSIRSDSVYVGDCVYIDEHGQSLHTHRARVRTFEDLVDVRHVWRGRPRGHIVQPEVLFPRQLFVDVGGLDSGNHRTMDVDLWGRFFLAGAAFEYTHVPFAMFRVHADQKTRHAWATTQSLVATAEKLTESAHHLSPTQRQAIVADLRAYEKDYWRETGRLARLGLPPSIVMPLNDMRASLRRRAMQLIRSTSWRVA